MGPKSEYADIFENFVRTLTCAQLYLYNEVFGGSELEEECFQQYEAICRHLKLIRCDSFENYYLTFTSCDLHRSLKGWEIRLKDEETRRLGSKWITFVKDYINDIEESDDILREWLMLAIGRGDLPLIYLLLENGANMYYRAEGGIPPLLHLAFVSYKDRGPSRHQEIYPRIVLHNTLVALLSDGYDPNYRNDAGADAYEFAETFGVLDTWFDALEAAGIDMERYLAILNEEHGESTAIEGVSSPSKGEINLRRVFEYESD